MNFSIPWLEKIDRKITRIYRIVIKLKFILSHSTINYINGSPDKNTNNTLKKLFFSQ